MAVGRPQKIRFPSRSLIQATPQSCLTTWQLTFPAEAMKEKFIREPEKIYRSAMSALTGEFDYLIG